MNLIRMATWAIVLTAAVMSGPNATAQVLAAVREVIGTATRLIRRKA
jgi:hypothetical protein